MVTCTSAALKKTVGFADKLISNRGDVEKYKVAYISKLTTLFSDVGNENNPEFVAKVLETALSTYPSMILGIRQQKTMEDLEEFLALHRMPDINVQNNLDLLGPNYNSPEGVYKFIKDKGVILEAGVGNSKSNLKGEVVSLETNVESYDVIKSREKTKALSVKDAASDMAKRKAERIDLIEGLKRDSSDMWSSVLDVYFPSSNRLGADFTEWTRENFFNIFIDFSDTKLGFVATVDTEVKEFRNRLLKQQHKLQKYTYGDTDAEFLNNLLNDKNVRERYYTNVLLNDFDFILENLIKLVHIDQGKTESDNSFVEGLESNGKKLEPLLFKLPKSESTKDLVEKIEGSSNRFILSQTASNELYKLSINSDDFINNKDLGRSAFYHTLADDSYFYRDIKGVDHNLAPVKYYKYNGNSKRSTSSIDQFVNPLDNASNFINNMFPLLKMIDSDGNQGRRMNTSDFIAIAPLLNDIEPTLEALEQKLVELASNDATKIAAIARSLHTYVFSVTPTFKGRYNSLRIAGRQTMFSSINKDIINALHSALISKDHLRYVKVEEGRLTVTKGPNKGTESQIIDEALAGYILDVNKYTKRTISSKLGFENNKLTIKLDATRTVFLDDITSMDGGSDLTSMRYIARSLGLEDLYNDIVGTYGNNYKSSDIETNVIETFSNIIKIASANSADSGGRYTLPAAVKRSMKRVKIHPDYMYLSPSVIIKDSNQKNLAEVFFVDSSKAQRIGDKTTQSSTTPNRNTYARRHAAKLKDLNDKGLTSTDMSHIPYVAETKAENSNIEPAKVGEVFIKAPIVYDGNVVNNSDWDTKIRIEHAMVEGFLRAPRKVGQEFFLQVVNYSDKSNPEMISIETDKNLLSPSYKLKTLKDSYIEYNYRKNEAIQRVTLHSFKEYILSDYTNIVKKLEDRQVYTNEDITDNLKALQELKYLLISTDFDNEIGDILFPFNELLKRVGLSSEMIEQSNADLDKGADYISLGGIVVLKPTTGIRAELYRDPVKAKKLVDHYLKESKNLLYNEDNGLENYVVDRDRIESILESKNDVTGNVDDFFDRFFLINGIYGHSLKTITMGDETYFSGRFSDSANIDEYYASAYRDLESQDSTELEMAGLEGIDGMLTGQFKRSQSILTRGVLYSQKTTLVGMKKASNKDNLLQHLEIYKNKLLNPDTSLSMLDRVSTARDVYRFKDLEGKTYTELLGKGVIVPIVEGKSALYAETATGATLVKFKIGNEYFTASSDIQDMLKFQDNENYPLELLEALADLINNRINKDDISIDTNFETSLTISDTEFLTSSFEQYRTNSLTLLDITDHYRMLENNKGDATSLPDFIASILITDPTSYVNLLNKMDITQENSDAIQMIHPLYELIKAHVRGNSIGAFNTADHNAQKTLNTTVEAGKNRQSLQKSSTQMHFSMEQMSKVGSVELYNLFKQMNSGIEFKQNRFIYKRTIGRMTDQIDTELLNTRINNLDDLFTYFGGYEHKGDLAWHDVFEVLKQNPIDLYSFIGFVNVPSNQKTGQKRLTKFEDAFAKEIKSPRVKGLIHEDTGRDFVSTHDKLHIGYDSSEYNFEVLTKEHEYDVSGRLNRRSSLALLSQLVNAVSFGGLSNVDAMSLQNAMGGRMRLNRTKVGQDLAIVAREMSRKDSEREEAEHTPEDYAEVIATLNTGSVATDDYTESQKMLFDKVLRSGVYNMAQLAFNESADSVLIKKMIEGEGFSLDTPAIQAKVMGTLRAAFFGDTVKQRMSGFQAVVSTTHKTINIFNLNSSRKSRAAYFLAGYELGEDHNWAEEEGALLSVDTATPEELKMIDKYVLPFDPVNVVTTVTTRDKSGNIIKKENSNKTLAKSSVKFSEYKDAKVSNFVEEDTENTIEVKKRLQVILTPDVLYDHKIDSFDKYEKLDNTTVIKVREGYNKYKSYLKWYYTEITGIDAVQEAIAKGDIEEDITEKFSLKWHKLYRDLPGGKRETIEDTEAFKKYYRGIMDSDGKLPEEELVKLRAGLILETQRKKDVIVEGEKKRVSVWTLIPAEVVLPSYMRERMGMPHGSSLHDYLGNSTDKNEQRLHLHDVLYNRVPRGKKYSLITNNLKSGEDKAAKNKHYSKMITRIYASKAITERNIWYDDIYNYLKTTENEYIQATISANPGMDPHDVELSPEAMKYINEKKNQAFDAHIKKLGDSFMLMLDTVLTRIPGQSKQSGFVGRVVEFLDAHGNASFAPTEHLVTTGGDYDIDTLSVLTRTMDAEGIIYSDAEFRDDNQVFDFKLLDDAYRKEIGSVESSVKDYIKQYNTESDDYVAKLKTDLRLEKEGKNRPAEISKLEERIGFASTNLVDSDREEDIVTELINNIHSKYENILSNVVATSIINSLNNVDTNVELNTPISMSMFPAIIKRLKQMHGESKAVGMNGETYWPIFKYEELAAQGKEAIGIYATVLKINSAIQTARVNYRHYAEHAVKNTLDPFIFDHTISFMRIDADGKKESVVRHRESFADLDRFNITEKASRSISVQNKLRSLQSGSDKYDADAVSSLVNILEQEISTAVGKYLNVSDSFSYDEKQALLQEFKEDSGMSEFDEKFMDFLDNGINALKGKALDNEFAKRVGDALDVDMINNKSSRSVFIRKLRSSRVKKSKKNIRIFESILSSTFGIEVPTEVKESGTPLYDLKLYLTKNPKVVEEAYLNMIGKQLSNDVQSQFLSAATDNAKELYLGKIRSSTLTNPVITTMMVLGYEIDDIIDFLYDPSITNVLLKFSKEKSNLKRVSLRPGTIRDMGIYEDSAVISLISLLEISDQITKFRDIRGLNENAKIEQATLDKILDNIDSDKLYKVILEDNFVKTIPTADVDDAVKVFNPDQLLFLHPQSRDLFINLYESEVYKMTSLFNSVQEVKDQAGNKGRDPLVYKNIRSVLSGLKVEAFLKEPMRIIKNSSGEIVKIEAERVGSTLAEGEVEETKHRVGIIMHQNENGSFDPNKKTRVGLHTPENREAFILNFPKYLEYAKTLIDDNEGLKALAYTNTFRSTQSILAVPKLKNSNVDPVDAALIIDGFKKLKSLEAIVESSTGVEDTAVTRRAREMKNNALNEFKAELYNNLSYYALIVSKGEVRKGSMIELFEEINFEFGEFLSTLDQEYYRNNFRVENEIVQQIVNGKLPTLLSLYEADSKRLSGTDIRSDDGMMDDMAYGDVYDNNIDDSDSMYDMDMGEYSEHEVGGTRRNTSYDLSNNINVTRVIEGDSATVGRAFRIVDKQLKDAIFYAPHSEKIAYRFFDTVADQALPFTTEPSFKVHSSVPFLQELGLAGKQLGFRIKYKGKDAWILNFTGNSKIPGTEFSFDSYTIETEDRTLIVPDVYLMKEPGNEDLFLKGNIIEVKNASNIRHYDRYKAEADHMIEYIPKVLEEETFVFKVKDVVSNMFTQEELLNDPIIKAESKLLFYKSGSVILPDSIGRDSVTKSLNTYMKETKAIPRANEEVDNPLIPSVKVPKYSATKSVEGVEIIPEIKDKVINMINSIKPGSSITFSGLVRQTGDARYDIVGGLDILEDILKPYLDEGARSFSGDAFSVDRVAHSFKESFSYKITRNRRDVYINLVEGGTNISSWIDPETNAIKTSTKDAKLDKLVKYKMIDNGNAPATHLKVKTEIEGKMREVLLFNAFSNNFEAVVKIKDRGFNDKYYKLKVSKENQGGINERYLTYYTNREVINNIEEEVSRKKGKEINLKC